ncbi:MAG: holo-ACP synthase [Bacteroidetes bacterium]|nr:holo-ACP synthase [Bacteroidota bacterium]
MVLGLGIDIIEVKRIRKIMEDYGDRFLKRILTDSEINYCMKFSKPELHLAGRFASKEAYSKSIGTGIGKSFSWKDIEILNDERGKPFVVHIKDTEYANYKFQISISHTEEYACAAVTCEDGK